MNANSRRSFFFVWTVELWVAHTYSLGSCSGGWLQSLEAHKAIAWIYVWRRGNDWGKLFGGGDGNMTLVWRAPAVNNSEPSSGEKKGCFFLSLSLIRFHFKAKRSFLLVVKRKILNFTHRFTQWRSLFCFAVALNQICFNGYLFIYVTIRISNT